MPGERRISWVAEDEPTGRGRPGQILGHVHVLLLGDIGVLEVLVHPDVRRTGLGRELVLTAARRVYQEGFPSIGVEVVGGTPAIASTSRWASPRSTSRPAACSSLSTVDWTALGEMATGIGPATSWSSTRAGRPTT